MGKERVKTRLQKAAGRFIAFRNLPRVRKITEFFYSPFFLYGLAICVLSLHTLGIDELTFAFLALVGGAALLFCPDALPALAVLVFVTAAKSVGNRNYESFGKLSYVVLALCGVVAAACAIIHIFVNRSYNNLRRGRLYLGYLLLGAGLLPNGFFADGYTFKNIMSGLTLVCTFVGMYFVAKGGVRDARENVRYFSYMCFVYGMVVSIQLCLAYFMNKPFIESGFDKMKLHTGWGMSNSIGGAIFRGIPMTFYLMCTEKKHNWYYFVSATLMVVAMVFTSSRAALLMTAPLYCVCYLLCLIYGKNRKQAFLCGGVAIIGVLVFLLFFRSQIVALIQHMLNNGMGDNGRFKLWNWAKDCVKHNPLFGAGLRFMYKQTVQRSYCYFHNTPVQFLATGGLVGCATYLFHRKQTAELYTQKPTLERAFLGILAGGILLISLLDVQYMHLAAQSLLCPAFVLSEHDLNRTLPFAYRFRKKYERLF
ncbi:MAG: O-antigen ligase family protein [Clostridiales bacterium]|nr:O-antigen ligase family protein [Clostridiales bacterium]